MCNKNATFFLATAILLSGCLVLEEDMNPEARHQLEELLIDGMKKEEFHSSVRRIVREPIINEFNCSELPSNEDCLGHSVVSVFYVQGKPTWNCGRLEIRLEAYFDKYNNLFTYKTDRGVHCP